MSVRLLPFALLAVSACFETSGPTGTPSVDLGPAPVITLVSGGNQTVPVGSEFTAPVRVRLTNADGTSRVGTAIGFHFMEPVPGQIGGGIITGRMTDAEGVAEIRFTPTRAGTFTVRAYLEECPKPGWKTCEQIVVRAEVTVAGTATAN